MKLITEISEDVEFSEMLNEATGSKSTYIEGIFMQAEEQNINGRIYPKAILEEAVDLYTNTRVKTGRASGELDHPQGPKINSDRISHRITSLKWDGNNVVGKALVLNTPMGQIVNGLLEGGVKMGVSSRGMGNVAKRDGKNIIEKGFMLNAVDIVQDPSAPAAFVNGIMEGVDWIYENGIIKPQQIEKYETEIKKTPRRRLDEAKLTIFEHFLSELKTHN